jgi:4-amino-4-deoxy-L-arabinose transferase-like glycosyltransferase
MLVLAVATVFRLWRLDVTPPGLFGDEAVNGLDALDVLAGNGRVFFPANFGREGLHMYLIAAAFRLMGVSPLAVRFPSVIAGILSALATYWLGRELCRHSAPKLISSVPLLAALWLSTAYWHVHWSRFGIRGVFTPLFGTLAFAAFWRGVNIRQAAVESDGEIPSRRPPVGIVWFALSGAFLGLSAHFYTASRLFPVFLGSFLLLQAAATRNRSLLQETKPLLRRDFWPIVLLFAVAAVVFAPLGYYFITHPGSFALRAGTVIASGEGESAWLQMGRAVIGNVRQFFEPGQGDRAWFYNLPGRALLDPLTAVLTLAGLAIAIRRWRKAAFLFLLVWWPIMMVPAFLAVDRIPTAPRVLGVLPGIYFFPALAVGLMVEWLRQRLPQSWASKALCALVLVVPVLLAGASTARDYFAEWAPSAEAFEAFDGESVAAAKHLNDNPAEWPVYLSAEFYRHASFTMLHGQVPTTAFFSYRDPEVRWFDGTGALPLPPDDTEATYIFTGLAHTPDQELDRYLSDRQLEYEILDPAGLPSVTVYRARYRDWRQVTSDLLLTDGVHIIGYDIHGEVRPGQLLGVALYWRFDGPVADDAAGYRVRLGLLDVSGQLHPSADNPLQYRPAEWDPQARAVSWHTLALPANAQTGPYSLAVSLARADSGLAVADWQALPASFEAWDAPTSETQALFGGRLRLLDSTAWVAVAQEDTIQVELVLRVEEQFDQAFTLFIHAFDEDGQRIGQRDSGLGGGLYALDLIPAGGTLRDTYRVHIKSDAGQPHLLALGFYDWRTGDRLPASASDGRRLPDDQHLVRVTSEIR